MEPKLSA